MDIPFDLMGNEIWRYLPVGEILRYCQSSSEIYSVCEDPETWRYLLLRDYSRISATDDPRSEYEREYDFEREVRDLRAGVYDAGYIHDEIDEYGRQAWYDYSVALVNEQERIVAQHPGVSRIDIVMSRDYSNRIQDFRINYLINLRRKYLHDPYVEEEIEEEQ